MLHEDRERATSFGADPELYDRSRPTYPGGLVDHLVPDGPRDVLDVGCGTGIAGALFRDRGCRVLGVEIDPRMAAYARRRGLDVEVGRFEDWTAGGRAFDLVIAGQAWHWIDPRHGAVKAADVLRPGGRVALFWNLAGHPPAVQSAFDAVYRAQAPGLDGCSVVLGQGTGDRFAVAAAGLSASGRFGPVEQRRFRAEATYSTGQWLEHLRTHSDHRALPPARRDRLFEAVAGVIDGFGGSFTTTYETVLVTAVRA